LLVLCVSLAGLASSQRSAAKKPSVDDIKVAIIDINSASEDTLKSIPGIGDAYAQKIIAARPYRAKNELVSKKVLPQGVYDKIRDRIVARQK
jgi:DNA uptake protein ComE-like DNA-binding protein